MQRRMCAVRVCLCSLFIALAVQPRAGAQASGALPSPWVSADIGGPSPAGSASWNADQLTVSGSGRDIWDNADQFQFVYQQISGDVDVIARIDSFASAQSWSKVGVMIRADLTAASAHAYSMLSGAYGLQFQRRTQPTASSTTTAGAAVGAPQWVRLVRTGTRVTSYSSADGSTWRTIGSDTIALGQSAYVGVAITSHTPGTLAQAVVSNLTVTSVAMPAGLTDADIGSPAVAGSSSYVSGVYTIAGGGVDIGGSSDQFHFVYQPVTGDVDVIARVDSLQYISSRSKAGVMVRETLNADSRNAMALVTAGRGYSFQWRLDAGGLTDATSGGSGRAPGWVRLVRTGQTFAAFCSADGANWTSMGTETVAMADTVYVGLAVTSHSSSRATTAVFEQFKATAASAGTNQPPSVSLTAPASGASYTAPADIVVSADASDPENRLARVEFFANTSRIGSVTAAPYSVTWSAVPTGTYSLTAIAFDLDGASTTSAAVTVDVGTANQPPSVSLTSPANGATFTAPATIAISAATSDPENQLTRVDFYANGSAIGTATAAPYGMNWTSVASGTYSLTAVATDAAGGRTTSAPVSVTVTSVNQPPTVALTSPADGASFTAPATVSLAANAADPEGRLAKVEFYVGTVLVATDTAAPFIASWSTAAAGTYQVKAVAYDADGGVTNSAVSTITVVASSGPRLVVFQASADHATLVDSYRLDIFANGADPNTATPIASSDLGKPTPDASTNDITVDRATFFSALPGGTYVATVSAVGAGGEGRSAAITFTR